MKMCLLTKEQFVASCREIHGEKYDYSKVEFKNRDSKVTIICPIHGEFKQKLSKHMKGANCKLCSFKIISEKKLKLLDKVDFIKKANEIHNNYYDYKLLNQKINKNDLLNIICPIHGEFKQAYKVHIRGCGCKSCGIKNSSKTRSIVYTKQQFIEKIERFYHDEYDYSLFPEQIASKNKLKIICKKHGVFEKNVNKIICDLGYCSKCKLEKRYKPKSQLKKQKKLKKQDQLTSFLQKIYCAKISSNNRSTIAPLEIDSYLVDINLGFEFNGVFWHSFDYCKNKMYHFNKMKKCVKKGIKLISIFEDDWDEKQEIFKNYIKNLMFVNDNKGVIGAERCEIKIVDNSLFRIHLKTNYNLGLYYNNELVFIYCMNINDKTCKLIEMAERNDLFMFGTIQVLKTYLFKNTNVSKITHDIDLSLYFKFVDFLLCGFQKIKFKNPTMFHSHSKLHRIYNCGFMHLVLER